MPFGVLVRFCARLGCVVARCTDRGPAAWTGREFDLSKASSLYPGRPCVHTLVALDDDERRLLAEGGQILLTLDGGELPWSLQAIQPVSP